MRRNINVNFALRIARTPAVSDRAFGRASTISTKSTRWNETRTHLALEGCSLSRTVKRAGRILCRPVLGGLHHEYVRI